MQHGEGRVRRRQERLGLGLLALLAAGAGPALAGERAAMPLIPEVAEALSRLEPAAAPPPATATQARPAPAASRAASTAEPAADARPAAVPAAAAAPAASRSAAAPTPATSAAPSAPAATSASRALPAPRPASAAAPAPAQPKGATPAPLATGPTATARLRLDLERAPEAVRWMALTRPDRLVIDLEGARAEAARQEGEGLVRSVRVARRGGSAVRVVLDLAGPARLTGVEAGRTLGLALAATSPADFAALVAQGTMAAPGLALAATPAAPDTAAGARALPLIMLDPGHGGQDVGAISVFEGRFEKDLTLQLARVIAAELEGSGRFRVALTRSDDRFIPLAGRVAIARRAGADLFLSIHGDSAPNPMARGATVYTLSTVASDAMAARVAARENKADAIATVPLAGEEPQAAAILYDLALRGATNASASFAQTLTAALAARAPVTSNSHRFAGFHVLKTADMPAALLETGYLTNEEDARRLFSAEGQRAIALAVRAALEAHFAAPQRLAAAR
jgi:N-acetylmuramoyl-L-alanine amidase